MKVRNVTTGDDLVAFNCHFSSVQTGTDTPVELDAVSFLQLDVDGKITEERRFFDVFMHVNADGKVEAEVRHQERAIDHRKMVAEIGKPVEAAVDAGSQGTVSQSCADGTDDTVEARMVHDCFRIAIAREATSRGHEFLRRVVEDSDWTKTRRETK